MITLSVPVDLDSVEKSVITRRVEGVWLPYVRKALVMTGRPEESGCVFVDADTICEVAEQGVWDSQFGDALLLGALEGLALEQAGLAVQETRGGYHGTDECVALVKRMGWM